VKSLSWRSTAFTWRIFLLRPTDSHFTGFDVDDVTDTVQTTRKSRSSLQTSNGSWER
jgi:hypothetical protein